MKGQEPPGHGLTAAVVRREVTSRDLGHSSINSHKVQLVS